MKPKRKVNWPELMALGFFPSHCAGWFMQTCRGLSTVALILSGSEWEKCHLTRLVDVLSTRLTTFQSLFINESLNILWRCLVKLPRSET